MTQTELEKLYRSWSDEKLIETYKKRFDYTETAQEAMLAVIEERNILEVVEEKISEEKDAEDKATGKSKDDFEFKVLGEITDSKTFANRSRGINGEYMRGRVVTGRPASFRVMVLSGALFFFLIAVLIVCTVDLSEVKGAGYIALACVGAGVLLTFYWIRLYKNSKGTFVFRRQEQTDFFELQHGNFSFKAKAPFKYFAYYSNTDLSGITGHPKQIVTGILISDAEGNTIALEANQYRLPTAPPGWPERFSLEIPEGTKFFSEMLGHRLPIVKLKKILDGLHDDTEKFV